MPSLSQDPVQIPRASNVDVEAVKQYVLSVVSEKTGYPVEMLEMDLDLEADLGVDTVKQAELFATVRANYGIPRREDLNLSDYNTLAKVVGFVTDALSNGTGAEIEPLASQRNRLDPPKALSPSTKPGKAVPWFPTRGCSLPPHLTLPD